MPIHFHLKQALQVPLECDDLTPNLLADKSVSDINSLTVFSGRRQKQIRDLFEVTGDDASRLEFHGDMTKFRGIGRKMSRGQITVHGSTGMHCGAEMTGGQITVDGSADDWLGAEMKNGTIIVRGNAGKGVGAAYLASASGMKNGTIIIHGDANQEVGRKMRRGTIVVRGKAGDLAGLQMIGGTIILKEAIGDHIGAWMKKGTIVCLQAPITNDFFSECCEYSPTFLSIYAKHLRQYGVKLPMANADGQWLRYIGDASRVGQGELLVQKSVEA
ncbi:MAG: formylmethanofuran dehydrogenase subunit C [Fuerstiella sp.]